MLKHLLHEYIEFYGRRTLTMLRAIICYFRVPQFRIIVLIRCMQSSTNMIIKKHYQKKLKLKYTVDIGLNCRIGKHFWVEHYSGIVIGNGVKIGDFCTLYQGVTIGQRNGEYPHIGNNVTIYPGAIVLGDINIGDNSIILAGSVVLGDVPQGSMVGGNPAVPKQKRKYDKY